MPAATVSRSHEASTNEAHANVNNQAPAQASSTPSPDPTRSALLQFGTQARARAAALRSQVIGYGGVIHETYSAHVERALTEALNARMHSASIDERAEKRKICMVKLDEIHRFANEERGQLLYNLLTLPKTPLHDRTPSVERADHMAAEILQSDLAFLSENSDLWINDAKIDPQIRHQCNLLLSDLPPEFRLPPIAQINVSDRARTSDGLEPPRQ